MSRAPTDGKPKAVAHIDSRQQHGLSRRDLAFIFIDRGFELVGRLAFYAVWISGFYFAAQIAAAWAGKETLAHVAIYVMTNLEKTDATPWLLSLTCAGWAIVATSLMKRKTRYFEQRIHELETRIDPARTSSGLTNSGDTPRPRRIGRKP